ncbi:hypothetical protein PV416_18890 [Streptomyces ipomoeae]|uniref:hypothetical protein n=1 Tax=Streptomyces ipomoeae TaxID=103232 RepID=UPI0029A5A9BB|nr:hypothetical protein [Streptomyces ipomoeae]MDX2823122.1 hypothetical protein [Streptomyces ipomoeae]
MNRPDGDAVSQSRSTRRFILDRTPSIFAGTNSSSSRAATCFADTPSPPLGSDSTSSTIRR